MNRINIIRLSLAIAILISSLPSISCQQSKWKLIIPAAQFQEAPWSDYTSAKFALGIGIERSLNDRLNVRGVGWMRNGLYNVGPSSGNMKGFNFKISAIYSLIKKERFRFKTGIGYFSERIKVVDGRNYSHGTVIPNSIWNTNRIINGGEILLEIEFIILENWSIFATSGLQTGYSTMEDNRYGNFKGLGGRIPFLELVGLILKIK